MATSRVYPKPEQDTLVPRVIAWMLLFAFAVFIMAHPLRAADGKLVAHWKFDETSGMVAWDSAANNNAQLNGFPKNDLPWIPGRVDGALNFNSNGESNEVVLVPDSPSLNFATNLAFSLVAWVRAIGPQSQSAGIIAKGFGGGGEEYAIDNQAGAGVYRFFIRSKAGVSLPLVTPVHITGRWQHIVATYNGADAVMKLYVDGTLAGTRSGPKDLQVTDEPVSIGNRQSNTNTGYNLPFEGVIDDVRIYDYALDESEVAALYKESGILAPVFYVLPQDESMHTGETATFAAMADGTGPLSYQWSKKGVYINGATTPRLRVSDVRPDDDGIYTLQLTDARNASISVSAVLSVKLYYWQTGWFRALAVLATMLAVAGIVRLQERRKANKAVERLEQRHAVDRERMRIARDMHDEIGGKLSRISLLSEMVRRDLPGTSMVSRQITEISGATQDIIRTVDEIVWAVNPRHDNVQGLVYYIRRHAEEFFELTPVEIEFKQPPELPDRQVSAEVRHHLFCAVKEALNNVLKHAGASKLQITFNCTDVSFSVRIQDDGCGFTVKPQNEIKRENNSAGVGSGLINMTERMQTISGEHKLLTSPGKGTLVELTIPLE